MSDNAAIVRVVRSKTKAETFEVQQWSPATKEWRAEQHEYRVQARAIERARGLVLGIYEFGVADEAGLVWASWAP